MKNAARLLALTLCLCLFSGCAATIPIKAAATATKASVKTAKVAVKTTAKAGAALVPDKPEEDAD